MKRTRLAAVTLALALGPAVTAAFDARAQGVFPPPPPPGSSGIITAPAPGGLPLRGMGQPPPAQCEQFAKLRDGAQDKAKAIQAASKTHDRQSMCTAFTRFTAAEALVLKFLEDNKTACGIPTEAISVARTNHAKTVKIRDEICSQPKPKVPTLSDVIGTPSLDTAKNTRTGPGTFDTLTGNPLAK